MFADMPQALATSRPWASMPASYQRGEEAAGGGDAGGSTIYVIRGLTLGDGVGVVGACGRAGEKNALAAPGAARE
jgi:hypothetical protein